MTKIIRDIALGVNQLPFIASFNNSKISVVDVSGNNLGSKEPNIHITPQDSGAMPLYKSTYINEKITIKCASAWIGTAKITLTKTY